MSEENQEALEKEAVDLGWAPRDKWRGDPDNWVDAKTFIERGKSMMPLLKKNNEDLRAEIGTLKGQMGQLGESLRAAQAVIDALEVSRDEDLKASAEAARAELKDQLATALENDDHAAVAELTQKMTDLTTAQAAQDADRKAAAEGKKKGAKGGEPELAPEVKKWYDDHPDFIKNQRKVALAQAIAVEMRQRGIATTGAEFLDAVADEVEKALGSTGLPSKAEGGNGGTGRTSSDSGGSKGYDDLPQEAKDACERAAKRVVGPDRAHKDLTSWRKSYAKQYFAQE